MVCYIEEGDIFQIPQIKNYAHGRNCVGAMGKEHPSCGDSFLYDQGLSMLDLIPEDFITKEEFENAWQLKK